MTFDDLRALADDFFEWPIAHNKSTVTLTSALLFAQHVLQLREKSLGAENSAGMDALRNAAQRQLEALAAYRREIGLLTGVPDEQPCDAEVALRAALEQQAEPAWVCPESPEHRYAKPGHCEDCGKTLVLEQQAEPEPVAEVVEDEFSRQVVGIGRWLKLPNGTKLYTAPPQRKLLTDAEIVEAVRGADLDWQAGWTLDEHEPNRFTTLARAIEHAHGIGEEE